MQIANIFVIVFHLMTTNHEGKHVETTKYYHTSFATYEECVRTGIFIEEKIETPEMKASDILYWECQPIPVEVPSVKN